MSKNNHANHSNHLENHDLDNFSKTGYSNSRLNRHTKKQNRQFHWHKHEFNAIRLVSWGLAFIIMAILFVFIDDDNAKIKLIRLFAWIFLLFLVLAFLKYFINVFISRKLDVKYPLTSGETLKKSEPIENVWQLIAER